jgi:hypothetical protein
MSAWGTKVWQDDAADDVLIAFEDLLEAGATPRGGSAADHPEPALWMGR